jgi:hypothetical protein
MLNNELAKQSYCSWTTSMAVGVSLAWFGYRPRHCIWCTHGWDHGSIWIPKAHWWGFQLGLIATNDLGISWKNTNNHPPLQYWLRWLVITIDVTKLAKVGLNELWVPSTINKYCALMTKLFTIMIRSRDNSPLGDKPIISVLSDLHTDLTSLFDRSILTIHYGQYMTLMMTIWLLCTKSCWRFVDRQLQQSFNQTSKPTVQSYGSSSSTAWSRHLHPPTSYLSMFNMS